MTNLYAGIEAGGTKFNCMAASGPQDVRAKRASPPPPPPKRWAR
jgi:hypothetical protein